MGTIRFARIEDAEEILAIYAPYILETAVTFEYAVPTAAAFRARMEGMMHDYPYFVYEEAGEILGYAYAHRQMERAAYDWTAELTVYLKRGAAGRGIGARLYGAVLALLRLQNIRNAYALVVSPNSPSEALHERMGFERVAFFPAMGYKMGAWRDIIWYGKILCGEEHPAPFRSLRELTAEEIAGVLADYVEN